MVTLQNTALGDATHPQRDSCKCTLQKTDDSGALQCRHRNAPEAVKQQTFVSVVERQVEQNQSQQPVAVHKKEKEAIQNQQSGYQCADRAYGCALQNVHAGGAKGK